MLICVQKCFTFMYTKGHQKSLENMYDEKPMYELQQLLHQGKYLLLERCIYLRIYLQGRVRERRDTHRDCSSAGPLLKCTHSGCWPSPKPGARNLTGLCHMRAAP